MWRRTRPAKVTVIKPAPDGTAKVLQQLGTISLVLHNLFVPRSSPGGGRRGGEGRKLTDHRVQSEEEGESANLPHRRRDSRRRQERRMEDPEGTPPEPNTHLVCVRGGGRKGAFIGTKERSLDVSGPGSTCSAVNREQMQGSDGNESEAARGDLGPRLGPAAAGMSQQISAENCYEILTKAKSEGAEGVKELVYGFMSAHYLQVLRTPAVYGRLSAGERELILARRMEGSKVLAVAETCEPQERGGGRDGGRDGGGDGGRPQSPLHDGAQRRVFCLRQDTLQWETLQFEVERGGFLPEVLPSPADARGALMPFVLCLNRD
ncbi:hypothetical protein Q5P01_004540 [Channa striata]|uniref:Uncharacterized protein n=1 Tax=Channa striata TaxID=64152 RepID=A0AA88T0G5_CHASR|nr:hypothetical protein Q5P01_004540 [Channa striata]